MERKIEESMRLEDGQHTGEIVGVEERETKQGYRYIDVFIKVKEGQTVKASYPDKLTTESGLGNLLVRFGGDVSTPGIVVNIESILLNKACQFMVMTQKGKDGKEYANVISDSVKQKK